MGVKENARHNLLLWRCKYLRISKENERQGGSLSNIELAGAADISIKGATHDRQTGAPIVIQKPVIIEKPRTIRDFFEKRQHFLIGRQELK